VVGRQCVRQQTRPGDERQLERGGVGRQASRAPQRAVPLRAGRSGTDQHHVGGGPEHLEDAPVGGVVDGPGPVVGAPGAAVDGADHVGADVAPRARVVQGGEAPLRRVRAEAFGRGQEKVEHGVGW
jgi:hypothetical protein